MNLSIENKILSSLTANQDYIRKVLPFIDKEYFFDRGEQFVFEEIKTFFNKYNAIPSKDILLLAVTENKSIGEKDFLSCESVINSFTEVNDNQEWLIAETEKFCKDRAIHNAIRQSIGIIDDKDKVLGKDAIPSLLQNALAVSFDKTIGHDYLADVEQRYDIYHQKENKLPFDLNLFNKITDGGMSSKTLTCVLATTGCHVKGSGIMLHNGDVKLVEDVQENDILMGGDGTPRNVNYLIRGKGKIYEIEIGYTKDKFRVNEDHILSLYNVTTKQAVNISVKDYLVSTNQFKHLHKMYYCKSPIVFDKKDLKIDPYFMGIYLGDGHTHASAITTMDDEIKKYVYGYISSNYPEMYISVYNNGSLANTYSFRGGNSDDYGKRYTPLTRDFIHHGLRFGMMADRTSCENKFIPKEYLTSTVEDRLNLLAGLIDTDGHKENNGLYSYCTKSLRLAEDVKFLARSLNMYSSIRKPKVVNGVEYYNVCISTSLDSEQFIPCKVEHKKTVKAFTKNKNPLHRSFSVTYVGEDDYYGFNLDGDNLYLMDNFIVTHNSGKSMWLCHHAAHCLSIGKNVLYISMEMSEARLAERIDANLMNIDLNDLKRLSKREYVSRMEPIKNGTKGSLVIKEYPTSSAHAGHFDALIQELKIKKKFVPDVIMVDYLNICASQRYKASGNVNSYTMVKAIAEELRALAVKHDLPIFSASQLTRSANGNSDPDLTHVSESAGLSHTADFMFALVGTEDLEKKGQIMIKQLKNRFGDLNYYNKFLVGIRRARMRFYDLEEGESVANIQQKAVTDDDNPFAMPSKFKGNYGDISV